MFLFTVIYKINHLLHVECLHFITTIFLNYNFIVFSDSNCKTGPLLHLIFVRSFNTFSWSWVWNIFMLFMNKNPCYNGAVLNEIANINFISCIFKKPSGFPSLSVIPENTDSKIIIIKYFAYAHNKITWMYFELYYICSRNLYFRGKERYK